MGSRVHVCSVERQLEPRLPDKLVVLCESLRDIVRTASNMNENARCTVKGSYLSVSLLQIDGFCHINDDVRQAIMEECEIAFGTGSVTLKNNTYTGPNSLIVECTFQERGGWGCIVFILCTVKILVIVACLLWFDVLVVGTYITELMFNATKLNATTSEL